jgi:hypothetical protein
MDGNSHLSLDRSRPGNGGFGGENTHSISALQTYPEQDGKVDCIFVISNNASYQPVHNKTNRHTSCLQRPAFNKSPTKDTQPHYA